MEQMEGGGMSHKMKSGERNKRDSRDFIAVILEDFVVTWMWE